MKYFLSITFLLGTFWQFSLAQAPEEKGTKGFEWVIKPKFKELRPFSHNVAAARYRNKWGYIDKKGAFVIDAQYDKAGSFGQKGLGGREIDAWVEKDGERFLIDKKGKRVGTRYDYKMLQLHIDRRSEVSEGLIGFARQDKWGFVDGKGKEVIAPIYDDIRPFSKGMAYVKLQDKWGTIDRKGNVIIAPIYEYMSYFYQGLARVKKK